MGIIHNIKNLITSYGACAVLACNILQRIKYKHDKIYAGSELKKLLQTLEN